MTDIDKAAREYALKRYPEECGDDAYEAGLRTGYRNGYVDSHKSRQPEIDELIEALEEATRWIPVSERLPDRETLVNVRPKEGQRIIVACMAHPGVWFDDLGTASYVPPPDYWRPIDAPKATQLLEKYGKK